MKNIKVLIIVPDKPEQIKSLVEQSKYSRSGIDMARSTAEGLEYVSKNKYDIILLDPVLPNGKGMHVYSQIHDKCEPTPIIVISDNETMVSELVKAGAYDNHLRTDLNERLLNKSIQYAIKRNDVEQKLRTEKNNNKVLYDTLNVLFNCASDIIWSKNADNETITSELIKAGAYDNHLRTDLNERLLNKSIQYAIKRGDVEQKLRKEKDSNKKLYDTLNVLFNCASDIIWSKNANNEYDIVNNTFLNTINMKKSDIIGKKVEDVMVNENIDVVNSDNVILKTQKPYRHVERVFLNDGRLLWWDVMKSPVFNHTGDVIGIVGTARDITEKVETEERIRLQLDSKIMDWAIEQDQNMTEIRTKIANTVKQIDGFKETLDEYNRR